MKRIITLAIICLLNSSCVYVGYGGIGEAVYTSKAQSDHVFHYTMLKTDLTKQNKKVTDIAPFEVSDIITTWGEPDEIIIVNEKSKRMTYNKGIRWKGMIIIIGLPISLAIPVGHKTISFDFENDKLINWTIHDDHYCVSYAGFNLLPINDAEGKTLGLLAESSCKVHKDMTPYEGQMACAVPFYDKCYTYPRPEYGRGENLK